jgi:hypothetical protein
VLIFSFSAQTNHLSLVFRWLKNHLSRRLHRGMMTRASGLFTISEVRIPTILQRSRVDLAAFRTTLPRTHSMTTQTCGWCTTIICLPFRSFAHTYSRAGLCFDCSLLRFAVDRARLDQISGRFLCFDCCCCSNRLLLNDIVLLRPAPPSASQTSSRQDSYLPDHSFSPNTNEDGIIVLRKLGLRNLPKMYV